MTIVEEEPGPIKVRTGLFAIMTAMLENAHDVAVKGQSSKSTADDVEDHITDIRSILGELKIQLDAAELIVKL